MTKPLISILFTLSLFSCANNDNQNNSNLTTDTTVVSSSKSVVSLTNDNYFRIGKDSITILPFEIGVILSPKAEERITKGKETIIVHVFFTGTPKDSSQAELEEDGSFFVSSAKKEILYGEVARFDSIKFPKKIYNQLADKDIDLGVNVYSGRKSSQDNLLNGDALFDKISNVVNKRFTLNCKLIHGDD